MLLLQRETKAASRDHRSTTRLAIQAGEQRVELPLGRMTIGSSPRCAMRLQQPGVQPLHCLIIRDAESLRIRRWAGSACLNGGEFQEATLAVGDRLSIGSTELAVVELEEHGVVPKPVAPLHDNCVESEYETPGNERVWEVAVEVEREDTAAKEAHAVDQSWQWPADATKPGDEVEDDNRIEEVTDALRQQREAVDQLVGRIETLERGHDEFDRERMQWQLQLSNLESDLAAVIRSVDDLRQEIVAFCAAESVRQQPTVVPTEFQAREQVEHPEFPRVELNWEALRSQTSNEMTDDAASRIEEPAALEKAEVSTRDVVEEPTESRECEESVDSSNAWLSAPATDENTTVWSGEPSVHSVEDRGELCVSAMPNVKQEESREEEKYESPSSPPAEPQSFIERYSHLFTDEPEQPAQRPQDPPAVRADAAAASTWQSNSNLGNHAAQPPFSDDEEESIEQYMAKLLQRVRGEESPATEPKLQPAISVAPLAETTDFHSARLSDGVPPSISRLTDEDSRESEASGEPLSPTFWMDRKSTSSAAAATDLGALRALANETARRAISTHALRKHRRNAVTKVIVSTLAGMTSLLLMLQSPAWYHYQFIVACVSLMVAAYWAGQAYRTLTESMRIAANDGDENKDEVAEAPATFTLPIDVERIEEAEPVSVDRSEPAFGTDIVEVSEMVADADVVEDSAETA